jgi:hypothetical protein
MDDPSQCGCPAPDPASGSGSSTDPNTCWPPPLVPGDCGNGMTPDHPPGDFGCEGSNGS